MTSIRPKFCSNCGKTLKNLNKDNDKKEIKKCPKCGIDLLPRVGGVSTRNSSVVDQLPYKSPGRAALIAFIGGIFALLGLGHIYWKCGKRNWNINIWHSHLCCTCYYSDILFFLQGLSFLASGSPTIGIESISTIFVLVVLHILFFGYGKYLTLEKEQRNLMK